jgi:hypothetical protein
MSSTLRFNPRREDTMEPGERAAKGPKTALLLLAGLGVLLIVLATIAAIAMTRPKAVACSPASMDSTLSRIESAYQHADFGVAIALAEHLLESGGKTSICGDTRSNAGVYWYESATAQLLGKARPEAGVPNSPLAMHEVAQSWQAIEQQADSYSVPATIRMPARVVATEAGNAGQYELAILAFQHYWSANSTTGMTGGNIDLRAVGWYSQMLTTWGSILSSPAFPAYRDEGVRALATANSIVTAAGLGDRRACQALTRLGYTDCTSVTPDTSDPVLTMIRSG